MDKLEKLLQRWPETAEEFLAGREQIYRQGRVRLDQNRVFRVANEAFDTQVLFCFLEERLDFPALPVNVSNSFGAQPEMACRKLAVPAAFPVPVADTAQTQGSFSADDLDNVVGCDAGVTVCRAALREFVHGVPLEAGHEKTPFAPSVRNRG